MLSACGQSTLRADTKADPFPIHVPAECRTPCAPLPAVVPDRPDGSASWDVIGQSAADQDAQVHDRCDAARDACLRTLNRLEQAGVIRTKTP